MMLCLAQSLADIGGFDPEDIMAPLRRLVREPAARREPDRARPRSSATAPGTHWDLASRRAFEILGGPTAGNGSLMRCAPDRPALRARRAEARSAYSQRESTLTHFDRLAGWSCVAFNDLIAAALAGELRERLPLIAATIDDEDKRVSAALREAVEAEPEEVQSSAFVLDTLRTALWAVLRTASFEEAVVLAVNLGNDADTVGAVTGALAGAVYGEAGIPRRWLDVLLVREQAAALADRLAGRSPRPRADVAGARLARAHLDK